MQRAVERVRYVEILAFLAQLGRAQAHGKQHALETVNDGGQRFARGKLARANFAGAALLLAPAMARCMQGLDDARDVESGHEIL